MVPSPLSTQAAVCDNLTALPVAFRNREWQSLYLSLSSLDDGPSLWMDEREPLREIEVFPSGLLAATLGSDRRVRLVERTQQIADETSMITDAVKFVGEIHNSSEEIVVGPYAKSSP